MFKKLRNWFRSTPPPPARDPVQEVLEPFDALTHDFKWDWSFKGAETKTDREALTAKLRTVLSARFPDDDWQVDGLFDHVSIERYRADLGWRTYHVFYWHVDSLITRLSEDASNV